MRKIFSKTSEKSTCIYTHTIDKSKKNNTYFIIKALLEIERKPRERGCYRFYVDVLTTKLLLRLEQIINSGSIAVELNQYDFPSIIYKKQKREQRLRFSELDLHVYG